MSPKDADAEDRAEQRSEFLRGQMRDWMEQVGSAGKTRDLFELEMWLRSFERFFRIKNQPLSEKETRQLALRTGRKSSGWWTTRCCARSTFAPRS